MTTIHYQLETDPNTEDDNIIRDGLSSFNQGHLNDAVKHYSFYAKKNDLIIAGVLIYQHRDAIYIDSLWVEEQYRQQGIGSKLLKMAEHHALELNITQQFVDTYAFQAINFYERHGFEIIATIPKYLLGNDRFYLKKTVSKQNVVSIYNKMTDWFDQARTKSLLMEKVYIELIEKFIPKHAEILDVGCGTGEPFAKYFIEQGHQLTGIDASNEMIALCQQRFPEQQWLLCDIKTLDLDKKFDMVMAWHSFFHLTQESQRKTLLRLCQQVKTGGLLVFTSGPDEGEVWSNNGGEMLYHASLASEEYAEILQESDFEVIRHSIKDEQCGGATVWVSQKKESNT